MNTPPIIAVHDGIAEYLVSPNEAKVLERASRILERELKRGTQLTDPAAAGKFFQTKLRCFEREVFAVMFLNNKHQLIAYEELFQGTVDGCEVHIREIARRALELNAVAIILGHNHPSGSPEPSTADRAVTARVKQALSYLDIRLLDHFVIGDGPPVSLAARGWV